MAGTPTQNASPTADKTVVAEPYTSLSGGLHVCRRWNQGPGLYLDERRGAAGDAQRAARQAGGAGVFSGGIQRRLPEGTVHVSRFDGASERGPGSSVWHQRGHVFRAEGISRPAAPDVSAVERLQ